MTHSRSVIEHIVGRPTSDGDGVKLTRIFGGQKPERFDPFLLMDEFGSDEAADYIGGFPPHPHRGFETVTYMLEGKMEHRDHMDNIGLISDGDVQWMTAGKGVIHSEMPQQTEGKMRGFQLWVNLPADQKLQAARYEDIGAAKLPRIQLDNGSDITAIAGATTINDRAVKGYMQVPDTEALYLDVHASAKSALDIIVPKKQNAFLYVYEGELKISDAKTPIQKGALARFDNSSEVVRIYNDSAEEARAIVIAGTPLKEPIVQYGPFVMNSAEEIEQATQDYRDGSLVT